MWWFTCHTGKARLTNIIISPSESATEQPEQKKKIVVRCLWHQSRWLLNISIYNYLKRRIITASVKCFAVRDGHWTQLEPYWNSNAVTRRYWLNNSQRRDIGRYDVGKQWSAKGYWTLRNAVVFTLSVIPHAHCLHFIHRIHIVFLSLIRVQQVFLI